MKAASAQGGWLTEMPFVVKVVTAEEGRLPGVPFVVKAISVSGEHKRGQAACVCVPADVRVVGSRLI